MSENRLSFSVGWVLALPPLFFLVAIIAASVGVAITGVEPDAIAQTVSAATPWLLLVVQILLLGLLATVWRSERLAWPGSGWRLQPGQSWWAEIGLGAALGVALAVIYAVGLEPAMVWAQRTLGDYVPAGELWPSLGASLAPFFIANVVLAPFAEEGLYRGHALPRLIARFGRPAGLVIHAAAFGLLHWSGGLWYMLLTGVVAGCLLAGLTLWRRQIVTAYVAHLALNAAEFALIAWTVSR